MTKRPRAAKVEHPESQLDLTHLRRETRTALELAIVAVAPSDLIDRLAWAAGLIEAIAELPSSSPPVVALLPKLTSRTKRALEQWSAWHAERLAELKA